MELSIQAQEEIKKNGKYLVILVQKGGCKGLCYNMFYVSCVSNYFFLNDLVLTDEFSLPFLLDIKLDFYDDIGYQDFVVENKAFKYCGCGKSFNKN